MDLGEHRLCKVIGDINGIECPSTHYCCKWGCCVSPAFQFYQLWYYWILVILMFMLCSGGGWWYRYWLAGRFPGIPTTQVHRLPIAELGNISRSADSSLSTEVALSRNLHRPCVRVSYPPARCTVLIARFWKVPANLSRPPPSYSQSNIDAHHGVMPLVSHPVDGPPPSYDSVMALNVGPSCNNPPAETCDSEPLPGTSLSQETSYPMNADPSMQETASGPSNPHGHSPQDDRHEINEHHFHIASCSGDRGSQSC